MRTILQIIPRMQAGGAEETVLDIVGALAANGDRALVASAGGDLSRAVELRGGRSIFMPVHTKNPITIWANARRLSALARRERVDLLHVHSRAPAFSALAAGKAAGIPVIGAYHGLYPARNPVKRWYNSAMTRGACVVAVSDFVAEHVCAEHGLARARIATIPGGVDLSRFDPAALTPARRTAMGERLAWAAPFALKLVLAGRVTRKKGHLLALEALTRLPSSLRARIALVFAGHAAEQSAFPDELAAAIAAAGLGAQIRMIGPVADMPALYDWADGVVIPSLYPEAFGRVAIEAQAMARPVIAAGHGGALETIRPDATGLFFAPGDASALAAALDHFGALLPEDRRRMGLSGRAYVGANYSLAKFQKMTLDLYADILEQSRMVRRGADHRSGSEE